MHRALAVSHSPSVEIDIFSPMNKFAADIREKKYQKSASSIFKVIRLRNALQEARGRGTQHDHPSLSVLQLRGHHQVQSQAAQGRVPILNKGKLVGAKQLPDEEADK